MRLSDSRTASAAHYARAAAPKLLQRSPKGGKIVAPWDWGSQKIGVSRLI